MNITSGAELTTSLTNLINVIIALIIMIRMNYLKEQKHRRTLWQNAFIAFILVSIMGVIIHGIVMPAEMISALWSLEYIFMALMLTTYSICIIYEIHGDKHLKRNFVINTAIGVTIASLIIATKLLTGEAFYLFMLYSVSVMVVVSVLLFMNQYEKPHLKWFLIGVIFLILGSILQRFNIISFTILLEFDHNCVYHVFCTIFLLFQNKGIWIAARANPESSSNNSIVSSSR